MYVINQSQIAQSVVASPRHIVLVPQVSRAPKNVQPAPERPPKRRVLALPTYKSTADLSFAWRLWHGINYMIGGITFLIGSLMYVSSLNKKYDGDVVAGWLYTIGSTAFLLADATEWNHFRYGCIGDSNAPDDVSLWDQSFRAVWLRAEVGVNFFLSAIGSTMYLVGSIFFIPATGQLLNGEYLFIYGSLVIFVSQAWKIFRAATFDARDPNSGILQWSNITADLSGFFVDLFAGLGGFFYMVGTIYFKLSSQYASYYTIAVVLYTLGGASFTLSGLSMQYRYHAAAKGVEDDSDAKSNSRGGFKSFEDETE